jgi:hypothetical protein
MLWFLLYPQWYPETHLCTGWGRVFHADSGAGCAEEMGIRTLELLGYESSKGGLWQTVKPESKNLPVAPVEYVAPDFIDEDD